MSEEDAPVLRPAIKKGQGVTDAERFLANLSEKSFLDLWSYPNVYRNQHGPGISTGKELCDLLVICHPHVIIFSEKTIRWPDKPIEVAWARWFRKAVLESVEQIRGSERWLRNFPDRVFLDAKCLERFPLDIDIESLVFHRIIVAQGSIEALQRELGFQFLGLRVNPKIVGSDHIDPTSDRYEPFSVGDIDPAEPFVHVFDEETLRIIMRELDTITDFVEYLKKKENFVRSGRLDRAASEADLLAYYAIRINGEGDHDFAPPDGGEWVEGQTVEIEAGQYAALVTDPRYLAKKMDEEGSYGWDRLIQHFSGHLMNGSSLVPDGQEFDLKKSETALRHMALVRRFVRRSHSDAIRGALDKGRQTDRFFRLMMAMENSKENETAFFIMTLKRPARFGGVKGYGQYRVARSNMAAEYAKAVLMKYPYLQRIVGIALEPPGQKRGASEDMVYVEQREWTQPERDENAENCKKLNILQGVIAPRRIHKDEYPDKEFIQLKLGDRDFVFVEPDEFDGEAAQAKPANVGNRKQRRRAASKAKRNR